MVAELLRERMFGGVTETSDPRLLTHRPPGLLKSGVGGLSLSASGAAGGYGQGDAPHGEFVFPLSWLYIIIVFVVFLTLRILLLAK